MHAHIARTNITESTLFVLPKDCPSKKKEKKKKDRAGAQVPFSHRLKNYKNALHTENSNVSHSDRGDWTTL